MIKNPSVILFGVMIVVSIVYEVQAATFCAIQDNRENKSGISQAICINGREEVEGYGVLRQCAEYGNDFHVRLYIHMAGRMYPRSTTALMYAAIKGHQDVISLLVTEEYGQKDSIGRTALMYAARYGHLDCVKLLCTLECSRDDTYRAALLLAKNNGHYECAEFLMSYKNSIQS